MNKALRKQIVKQCTACKHKEIIKKNHRLKVECTFKKRLEIPVPCPDFNK